VTAPNIARGYSNRWREQMFQAFTEKLATINPDIQPTRYQSEFALLVACYLLARFSKRFVYRDQLLVQMLRAYAKGPEKRRHSR
jgi:hypothetical protein